MEIVLLITITIIIFFIFFQKSWCGSVGDKNKGNAGERKVSNSLNFHLDEKRYCILNDVIISDNIGGSTQIDHVVLSPFGIFVVETKNLKGWIFGSVNSKMWMLQVFNEKYQFYNPIKQNYKHIACLSKLTKLPKKYFFPIVVFVGESSIKTNHELPDYVITSRHEMIRYIKSHKQLMIDDNTLLRVRNIINERRFERTYDNHQKHIAHIRDIISGQPFREIPLCPHCGSEMVKRQAKSGRNIGRFFWGCPRYPACRGIIKERSQRF